MSNEERDETRPDVVKLLDLLDYKDERITEATVRIDSLRESLSASQERERLLREDLRGAYDFLNALAKVLMKSEEEGGDVNLSATITNFLNGEKRGLGASREGGRGWLIGE